MRSVSARVFAALTLLLGAPVLLGAACPRKPADCEHDSLERCNWEEAVGATRTTGSEDSAGNEGAGDEAGEAGEARERDDLDDTVLGMVEVMAAGLEWELMDARARELCRGPDENGELVSVPVEVSDAGAGNPGVEGDAGKGDAGKGDAAKEEAEKDDASAEVWRCSLSWLEIDGESLELEASDGVISLSVTGLDSGKSEAVADFARARFDDRCIDSFEVYEGVKLDEFHRCALPEGPYLVVARFPTDVEATLWQVSIAVVDAG